MSLVKMLLGQGFLHDLTDLNCKLQLWLILVCGLWKYLYKLSVVDKTSTSKPAKVGNDFAKKKCRIAIEIQIEIVFVCQRYLILKKKEVFVEWLKSPV